MCRATSCNDPVRIRNTLKIHVKSEVVLGYLKYLSHFSLFETVSKTEVIYMNTAIT